MSPILSAAFVSLISMSVIFVILSSLIFVIKVLVKWMPHVSTSKPISTSPGDTEISEHLAAIHSALANHLKKSPNEIQISNIQTL